MEINERKREIGLECVEEFRKNNFYGAAIIGTGGGKTWMMLKCLGEIATTWESEALSILYTCNSLDLRDADFPNEVIKWGYEEYEIERMCYQSACKLEGKYYDVLLADEGDFGLTPEYIKLFKKNTFKYIILVSATLTSDKAELLKGLKIPIVYKKPLHELENESVVNSSKYYYVNYLLNEEENKRYLVYNRRYSSLLSGAIVTNNLSEDLEFLGRERKLFLNRLKSSAQVCRDLLKRMEGRTLVFSELTSQIDRICEYTYHGKNTGEDNLLLFNNEEINTLGVVGKIDRGVNLTPYQNTIIESCSSSKMKIQQKLGRGKRMEIDEFLNVFLQIPYFQETKFRQNKVKPTIVLKWLETALKDFNIPNIEVFKF